MVHIFSCWQILNVIDNRGTDSQENGTCVTIFKLWAVMLKDLAVSVLHKAFNKVPLLTKEDNIYTLAEARLFWQSLIHIIICIIVKQSRVPKLKVFSPQANELQPCSTHCIAPHCTEVYPFGAYDIDKLTITGNANIDQAVVSDLKLQTQVHNFWEHICLLAGNQLSLAHLWSIQSIWFDHEGGYTGFGWGMWMPGLFHAKMADVQGVMATHFGKPAASIPDPGSLLFHKTCLSCLPITVTSLPPFSTCQNLIFVSLYA
ncbi:hypothetical protein GYMLUDRAFT_59000 [Collybiopsis luxurians FD-317 M1]|uniref:DUF6589 domain-containing protein n=1 Tax=Collybiopsis luxurians FD-317 M1 TaxID=944289 RepID=A0A0D0CXQ1_9AGAR|nr:hypothetical protein GYMLUDRAFT_59000 [Collybiopsis luxurians FD-317 M1]